MAVDLADLVEFLKVEVNPPGVNLFPEALDTEWLTRLRNAFWNARMDGLLGGYVEEDGEVTPLSGTTDMPREMQQVIIFFAGYTALMNKLTSMRAALRAKAGPVEFEMQNAATVMTAQATSLRDRMSRILALLSESGVVTDVVIDAVMARADSLGAGVITWVR